MPFVPGDRNVSLSSHLRHVADRESNGAVQDRVPRSAALDEGRISGTGSGHTQTDGEIPQGLSDTFCLKNHRCAPIGMTWRFRVWLRGTAGRPLVAGLAA